MAQKKKDNRRRTLPPGITQREDKRYCYRKSKKGEKPICVYARTFEEIIALKNEIENGRYLLNSEKKEYTFDEFAEEFFRLKNDIRDTTKIQYMDTYKNRVSPYIGSQKLCKLNSEHFVQLFATLSESGLKFSTIQYVKIVCMQIINNAGQRHLLDSSCVRDGWGAFKIRKPRKKEKVRALTAEEQAAFMKYICENDRYARIVPLIEVLLKTGMRIGECLALTWKDIDFDKNLIDINKSLAYYKANGGKHVFKINPPKTDAGIRTIPMVGNVRDIFLRIKDNELFAPCTDIVDGYTDFVFSTENKNLYIATNLTNRIKEIVKRYNEEEIEKAEKENRPPLQIEPFSLHCLRHTFATNAGRITTDYKSLQSIMGHSSMFVTMDIYADPTEDGKAELMRLLEGKM